MGRKTRTIIEEEGEPEIIERPARRAPRVFEEEDSEITEFYDGSDKEIRIKLSKIAPHGLSFKSWLTPPLDEAWIQERWKEGGRYLARPYKGGVPMGPGRELSIEPYTYPEGAGPAVAGAPAQNFELELLKHEIQSLKENNRREATPITELVSALAALQQLQGNQNPANNVMDAIKLGMELRGSGSESSEGSWMGLLEKIAPHVAPALIKGMMDGNKNGNPPLLPPGAPVRVENPPTLEGIPENEDEMKLQQKAALMGLFAYLKPQALAGHDPMIQIDWALTNHTLPMVQELLVFVQNTSSFDELLSIDSDLRKEPYGAYFRALYHGLRSALSAPDSVEPDSGRSPGNVQNVNGHVPTGKGGRGK